MLTSLELIAAGACMGSSMTGLAVNGAREPNTAFFYSLIMMVIGTLAASLALVHPAHEIGPIYFGAVSVIAISLAIAALRAFSTAQKLSGLYFTILSTAVAFALAQSFAATGALPSVAKLFV